MFRSPDADNAIKSEIIGSPVTDVEVEKKLLGCLFRQPELIVNIENTIFPEYFDLQIHQVFYKAMMKIAFQGKRQTKLSFDYDTLYYTDPSVFSDHRLVNIFKKQGILDNKSYYEHIKQSDFSTKSFPKYSEKVKDNGARRQLYKSVREFQIDLINPQDNDNIDDLIVEYGEKQTNLLAKAHMDDSVLTIGEHVDPYVNEAEARIKENKVAGISTGYEPLDNSINYLREGGLYVFMSGPKVGKSTLLLNIANNIAQSGIPILYIDTEMHSKIDVVPRMLAMYSAVNKRFIENDTFVRYPEELEKISGAKEKIKSLPFYHKYKPGVTAKELASIIKLWLLRHVGTEFDSTTGKISYRKCVVIFDYLKITGRGNNINLKDYQILGDLTMMLKDMAGQFEFPCITAVQQNRGSVRELAEDLSNAELAIGNSYQIAQYSSYLFYLSRIPDYTRILKGMQGGYYTSYKPDMPIDVLKAKYSHMIGNAINEDDDNKQEIMSEFFGNTLLHLALGRQNKTHSSNNYFTLDFNFPYSLVSFTGELAPRPIGIAVSRNSK